MIDYNFYDLSLYLKKMFCGDNVFHMNLGKIVIICQKQHKQSFVWIYLTPSVLRDVGVRLLNIT